MSKDGKRKKVPKSEYADRGKEARSAFPILRVKEAREIPADPNARAPAWAFRITDVGGPWCWTRMSPDESAEVVRRLGQFETMTWREIDGPTGSHAVSYGSLIRKAQRRLEEIEQDDAAEYFSLRINGPSRVWGIRDGGHILRILWWDPHHEVCPSHLKHT